MASVETQLSVYLENRPGTLARACAVLSENGINVLAMSIHDTVDQAVARFLVDNTTKALLLIEEEGFYVVEQKVVILKVDQCPGALTAISRKLAAADINIGYAYCTAVSDQSFGCLVLKTSEPERAAEALSDFP